MLLQFTGKGKKCRPTEIPNHSSKSAAYVSVSDEHKAEAILFLVDAMLRNERWTPSPTTNASPTDTFSGPYKSAFDAISSFPVFF